MPLFDRLRSVLRSRPPLATGADGEPIDAEVLVATAALLVAAAYGDHEFVAAERQTIQKSLRRAFGISQEDADSLLEHADEPGVAAADLAGTARAIAARTDETQRQRILGLVWSVVYADRVVDDEEVAFADQVAEMLGVPRERSLEARENAFQWFSKLRHGD